MFREETDTRQKRLAWHETLELHELVVYQSNHLIALKMFRHDVKEPKLHALYDQAIAAVERNLHELLGFYPQAPVPVRAGATMDMTPFYAGFLLGFAKTAVRNYGIAITESATPKVRETLQKQLNAAVALHGSAYSYMLERGLYPSYDLGKLLAQDMTTAQKAVQM